MLTIPQVKPASINNQTKIQRAAAKIGKFIPNKISNAFEMDKMGTFGRLSLLSIALIFVLGVRFVKSRDAHERREVLTRDGITVGAAMVAVPLVKNWMQRGVDAISKIPTATERDKIFSLNDFRLDNLKNWYGKAEAMPEKVLTIAKNIVERKGDLKRAFATLGDEGMQHVQTMLQGADCTSDNILKAIEKASKSNDNGLKQAFDGLTNILSKQDNALVKAAQRLKAIPSVASLIFVTSLLGWGIPAFNIRFTRKKLKGNADSVAFSGQNKIEPKLLDSQKEIIKAYLAGKSI